MNSDASIRTGRRLVEQYGSWGEVLKHAKRGENGDYEVALPKAPPPSKDAGSVKAD